MQISGGKRRPPPTIFGTRKVESTDRQQTTDGRLIAYSERNVVRSLKTLTSVCCSTVTCFHACEPSARAMLMAY